jgi:hypothetical protein
MKKGQHSNSKKVVKRPVTVSDAFKRVSDYFNRNDRKT